MKFILGRKLGMTRVFDADGKSIAVVKVQALPCFVSEIRTIEKNGYNAVQVKASKDSKENSKIAKIVEFRIETPGDYKVGEKITLGQFEAGEKVEVEGTSKGKGFAGTIKRHGFHRGPESHGSNNVREPGSIGGGFPERVVKGRRMPGHMGDLKVTVKNLKVIDIDKDIILVSGAIPGPNKSIVRIFSKSAKKSAEASE
ncbi:MAG: 50S ribosomal protein L3 [Patescibacteria group bacterium]